jgi:hypothetical protein
MTATHCTKEGILIVLALLLNTPPEVVLFPETGG